MTTAAPLLRLLFVTLVLLAPATTTTIGGATAGAQREQQPAAASLDGSFARASTRLVGAVAAVDPFAGRMWRETVRFARAVAANTITWVQRSALAAWRTVVAADRTVQAALRQQLRSARHD